ncbi:MAG: SurA N-terminal domain-containing protein [Thermodesulfobacteriota bacterium]|nr:SurA N-terminal domain-containing protein [Thermodesulfobacteriota bacterium]
MLQLMRQKASSLIIKGVLGIIVLAFIFMGVGNFRERRMTEAAVVNGETITAQQFQNRYYRLRENYRRQFGGQLNEDLMDMLNLKQRAMDQLIAETLLLQKAAEIGFQVPDRELAETIRSMSVFHRDGRFDSELYTAQLQRNRMTPESFEAMQRRDLLAGKMRSFILDRVKVSADEAKTWYDWENAEVRITAAVFEPDRYTDVEPTPTELRAYFDDHQEKYKTPAKARVTYVAFHPSDYMDQVTVTDDSIADYYDSNKAEFTTEKKVEARHILLKVPQGADEATVAEKRQRAMEIYEKLQAGKDFAEAAKEFSEGPSAEKGGYLGEFTKDEMVAPFSEKAFSMAAGEISKPVRTQFGWHLIKVEKVTERSVAPLAAVRPEIEKKLTEKKATDLAYENALETFDLALNKGSVRNAAEEKGLVPVITGMFSRDAESIKGMDQSRVFVRQVFDLFEGEISDVVEIDGIYYLFQVKERKPAEVPTFEMVKHAVREDVKAQLQQEKAQRQASGALEKVKNGSPLAAVCKEAGIETTTTAFFGRNGSIPDIGREPAVVSEAFMLSQNTPLTEEVIKGEKGYFIIRLKEKRYPPDTDFQEKKEATINRLRQRKKEEVFSSWITAMRAAGEVSVEERFLE